MSEPLTNEETCTLVADLGKLMRADRISRPGSLNGA